MESENANEEQAKLRISEFNKVDTALVDKIYSLARLEVLDNIKSEILKWMAVLSLLLTGLAISA